MDNNLPPMPNAPPPLMPPPPAPKPSRGGRVWMIVALLLAVLLVISLAANFSRILDLIPTVETTGRETGRWLQEVTVENKSSRHKIAIVDVAGIITSHDWDGTGHNLVDLIDDQLEVAGKDRAVKAVVLKVDSPGGEVMASDDISRALTDFQEKHGKPVVAAMGGLAASGGYYVSVPCQWIVASEFTITGSIGVIMHSFNYRGLLDKIGLYPRVFKSGKFKDMLSGTRKLDEIPPAEQEMLQAMIDETFAKFKKVVAEGRQRAQTKNQGQGRTLAANWEEYADGRVLTGKQAWEHGFVDELGTFETAVDRAKKLAKIPNANLIRYEEPFDIKRFFRFLGQSERTTLKVDLGFDIPKLEAGRLYFLSPTVIH
ncbi:MAG: signal peptide peptidase SppA [Verrucomicrobiota bacterium]